ncbi:MAG: transporter substrate-binding domain-containing protein [Candidatus Kariarchaeaceae archaeon]|jgi:ABC-type amino acid transport substrate-binding protein
MKKLLIPILCVILLISSTGIVAKTITIDTIDDANADGVKIGVQSGTTSDLYAEDNLPKAEVLGYENILLALDALKIDDVHLVMGDKPVLLNWLEDETGYAVLDSFSEELFGLGVDDGETDLLAALNKALTEIIADTGTTGYDAIYAEWFPGEVSALYDDSPTGTTYAWPAKATATGDLKDIIDGKEIEFGTDPTYPPFENKDTSGNYEGFDVDMMYEIAERFSTQYEENITVKIVDSDWDPIIPNLTQGEFHVILSAMTKTAERDEVIDFTRAYYASIQGVLGPESGEIDVDEEEGLPLPVLPILASLTFLAIVVRRRK